MNKIFATMILTLASVSSFASSGPVVKFVSHPALLTRTYHGGKYLVKGTAKVGKVVLKDTYKVSKRILF